MKKRLAVLAATAFTALGAASGASAIIGNFPPQPHNGAPAGAQCGKGSVACKAPATHRSAPVMAGAKASSMHGGGYSITRPAAPAQTAGTNSSATATGR